MNREPIIVEANETYRRIGIYSWGRGMLRREPAAAAGMGSMKYFTFPQPSLVFSNIQAWEGAVALAGPSDEGYVCSSRFYPYVAREGADVSLDYLHEFFRSEPGLSIMRRASPGTQVRNKVLSRRALEASKIPIPDLPTQRSIAAHLASLTCRVTGAASPSVAPGERLPRILGVIVGRATKSTATLGELMTNRQVVVHPGDDLLGASEFIGLEHIEPHTGRRIGSRPIGNETGRKLLFTPGQVTFGYLRPYLNKAWAADRLGLCSVEQFTLTPNPGVDARVLSAALRSEFVWRAAQEATNSLQLPRLSLRALASFEVPDVRGLAWDSIGPEVERVTEMIVREAKLRSRRQHLHDSILPAARNEVFDSMR
jgi:hypothetical protein